MPAPLAPDAYVKLSREFAELGPIIETIKAYRDRRRRDRRSRGADRRSATDPEMRALASEREAGARGAPDPARARTSGLRLLPKDAMDERNVILEIRAGTGGDEAALFAGDLFRMYERYAAKQGWKVEVVSASEGSMGGYKEIIAEVRGRGAFAKLKFESGVHRVQRVPDTEGSGRIHTSAATVAVLPEAEDVDVDINETDLKIDTMRAQRRRRPACQQDRIRDPHHPHPERHRGRRAGGPLAAPQPRQGDGDIARQALRDQERRSAIPSAPPSAAARSAPATALSASAPIIFRKGASATTAST